MMFETDHEKIDDVDDDDDEDDDEDDDDGNYKFSGPQKSESVFFLVFLSQLEHPFSQISRLLVFQDQNESEYLRRYLCGECVAFSLSSKSGKVLFSKLGSLSLMLLDIDYYYYITIIMFIFIGKCQ